MLSEFETFFASGLLAVAAGLSFYVQRLYDESGNQKRKWSWGELFGWLLGCGVGGLLLSMWMWSRGYGNDDAGRIAIVSLNGALALAGIGIQAIFIPILKRYGWITEGKDARTSGETRKRPKPDSDTF